LSANTLKKSARSTTRRFARSCISIGEGELRSSSFSSSSSKNPSLEKSDCENEDDDEDDWESKPIRLALTADIGLLLQTPVTLSWT
jgi:hypothetical protein